MIRVAFNVRPLTSPDARGLSRYTVNLLRCLPQFGVEPWLCAPDPVSPVHLEQLPAGSYRIFTGGPRRVLQWDQAWPRLVPGADVLHAPGNFGLPLFSRLPKVATIHDAIDYAFYWDRRPASGKYNPDGFVARWMYASTRWAAERIITVSEFSKQQIHRRLRVPLDRIDVTLEAADPAFQPATPGAIQTVRTANRLHKPYYLYLGGWEQRKNLPFLLRAFTEAKVPDVELVLAGGLGTVSAELQSLAAANGWDANVRWLGRVSDDDLRALYTAARAFVYPSVMEGFGLQACEAMACGCPVFASDAGSLPEVVRDGGAVFPLNTTEGLVRLLQEPPGEALRERARSRSTRFSWERCAYDTTAVYRRVLEER